MKLIAMLRTGGIGRRVGAALLLVGLAATAACDGLGGLLDVDAPGRIPADNLEDPSRAPLLLNGAIADFECAFGAYTVLGGVLGEELMDATQTANRWPYDRREVLPSDALYGTFGCEALGVYTPLSVARWAADNILTKLEGWTDAEVSATDPMLRTSMIATAAAYSGYSHVLLGEGFCTGVTLEADMTPSGEVENDQVLQRAVERFTRAIAAAQAVGDDETLNMALVGRARAYLNLGMTAEAIADAERVPPGFVKAAGTSAINGRRYNRVYSQNNDAEAVSVGPAYRSFQHMGASDPRVPVVDGGKSSSDGTPLFFQRKYTALDDGIPLATWDEAQLILAEARGGQEAIDIVNMFHARAGLLPFAAAPTDAAAIRAHLIEERKAELFLESHHLGDIIRFDLALSPTPGTPFAKGGSYGEDGSALCLPLPNVERLNNPKIGG